MFRSRRLTGEDTSIKDILKRVERVRSDVLDPPTLQRMDEELTSRLDSLKTQALEKERELITHLTDGRGTLAGDLRKQLRQIGRQSEEIETERRRLRHARQERILRDRMVAKLGGRRRVQALEGLVLALIVLVLGLLYYDFTTPGLSLNTRLMITLIDTFCCVIFLADFFFRYRCADSKSWFWRRYWIDFITSIPIPDAQVLRFGRAARVARVVRAARFVRLLRAVRVILFFWRGMDKLAEVFDVRLMKRSLALGVSLLLFGALIIYWTEGPRDGMESMGQSIWWSFTTVVTGGFADLYNPTSSSGRVLTVLLVLGGMAIVGIFTATLTSVLVGDDSERLALMQKQLEQKLEHLSRQVEGLSGGDRPPRVGAS